MRTFFKGKRVTQKQARAKKARVLSTNERAAKQEVRDRDRNCRFPLCRCRDLWKYATGKALVNFMPTVSHDFHKGMGGDPTGAVSIPSLMVLLCMWRHQNAPVSRHAGTLKSRYLTPDSYDGPVAWLVDLKALYPGMYSAPVWVEVGREHYVEGGSGVLRLEPLTLDQETWLKELGEMDR